MLATVLGGLVGLNLVSGALESVSVAGGCLRHGSQGLVRCAKDVGVVFAGLE